eukprot:6936472-Prymnesium_polylepis.1
MSLLQWERRPALAASSGGKPRERHTTSKQWPSCLSQQRLFHAHGVSCFTQIRVCGPRAARTVHGRCGALPG